MKSIERRFFQKEGWSTYTAFAYAVRGQGFKKEALEKWFNKLVDKGDYAKCDKKRIIRHLLSL